ncbi:hypothetical protein D9756_005678 [Leucocoprinus leucothites]|uniref:Nephrocystin 3-like N-terminal domain-containing protein n=1 Tax=Leucocoprinus leucothites TaxID=201217 RepID=A0A8H5G0B3_9AGAR|nr:hypothetical protein D9756_005678 [Leucoagaricus leucothites]
MPLDSFIDSTSHRLPEHADRGAAEYFSASNGNSRSNIHYRTYAPFQNAHSLVIQNATMIDRAEYSYPASRLLMELLLPYTNPDAAMDSSARDPPPKCRPGTRVHIIEQLEEWLESLSREYDMLWLYGPAGTGKSAIAQTFAELCAERNRLGATFFFSRPNHRNKPESVIPSLAYQLTYYFPAYRLQAQGHEGVHQPFLIVLDGLDECAGARAQCEFIKMISELVRLKHGFPILWLLCMRSPGALLDEGSREDVKLFLRDSFAAIRDENPDIVPSNWPPESQLNIILYVDDPASGSETPVEQLNTLVAYLVHSERVGAKSPLAALDLIYFQILSNVPSEVFPVTRRVLIHLAFRSFPGLFSCGGPPAQAVCNMLQFDQSTFYNALRHLHSVLKVPSSENAAYEQLEFYHASFHDFLLNPNRSGVFALKKQEMFVIELGTYMLWYQSDHSAHFHDAENQKHGRKASTVSHQLSSHPALTWALLDDQKHISEEISTFVQNIWVDCTQSGKIDDLFNQFRDLDFRRSSGKLLHLLIGWILNHYPLSGVVCTEPTKPNNVQYRSYAPFQNVREFVIQNAMMIERAEYSYSVGRSTLELLHPYTNPDAVMDSSARDPPPKCHPGTCVAIMEQLYQWLESPSREYEMWWLYGPAGAGKSAIAQSFAEICTKRDHLGAAFFFSRLNRCDKPKTVIPSLTYQLMFYCPAYKSLVAQTLVNDPQLLQKAIRVQFKSARQLYLVLLDSLDECAGAQPQWEFIKMISELVRLKHGFPILWLLCSRPESHLKHVFSRTPECGCLELLLDEGSRDDVELFLRDSFAAIKDDNPDIVPLSWPPEDQLGMILHVASGLFVVASVALRYVDDPAAEVANPVQQLNTLVAYLEHLERVGAKSPLAALDLIYLSILRDVPSEVLPVTRQILVHLAFRNLYEIKTSGGSVLSTQAICNMLQFDQSTFYGALQCLHSVLEVPSSEDAIEKRLGFYHASFHDFLLDHS